MYSRIIVVTKWNAYHLIIHLNISTQRILHVKMALDVYKEGVEWLT